MDGLVVGARFNYAKVLFNLGDYDGAIKEFTAVQDYADDDKFREESSFSLVTAWQNKLRKNNPRKYAMKDVKPLLDKDGKLLPPSKLDEDEEQTIAVCLKYEKLNSQGKRLPRVWYTEAEIYFRNNMFDTAREKYSNVVELYPNDKVAVDSMRNMVASYTYEKNYSKVEEWSTKLLASKDFGNNVSSDTEEIKSLMTGSVFKSAKAMEQDGKYEDAANEYIRLAKQYPKSEYSDAALYNAGIIYEKVGDPTNAIRSYRLMLVKYPRSKHTVETLFRVAVNYEQQLDFPNSIYFYEEITKKHPKTEFAADAHYNAARIRRAYNQYDKAADHFMAHSIMAKEQKEKAESLMLAASLYDKSENYAKALNSYESYIKRNHRDLDGVMLSHTNKAKIYSTLGKKNLAYKEYISAINTFKASGNPSSDLQANEQNAEARFMLVYDLSNKYHSIKVKKNSVKVMKLAYDQKQKLLQTLSEQYLKIINLGSAGWSVAALYMLGFEFQKFAEFLYDIPIPKQINTEQLITEYKSQIQTQAMPYEDKAIEYYEKSISESARLKVANDWTKRARQRLSKLKPEQYKDNKDEIPVVYPSVDIKDYGFIGK